MSRGVQERINRASLEYRALKLKGGSDEQVVALISLSSRIPLTRIRSVVEQCRCELLQVQRTVGELQVSINTSNAQLRQPSFASSLEHELLAFLEFRLTSLELNKKDARGLTLEFMQHEYAAVSEALAESKKKGASINGLLVRATPGGLESIFSTLDGQILATEMVVGSARPFAIPLEIYGAQEKQ
jgi:hypothetical protein